MTVAVVDASLAVDAALGQGAAAAALVALARSGHRTIAPPLLWSEATSALHAAVHRGLLAASDRDAALGALAALAIDARAHGELHRRAWEIADRMGWARTYDAEYCALAELEDCALVTSDARLRRAADGRLPYVLEAAEAVARL